LYRILVKLDQPTKQMVTNNQK